MKATSRLGTWIARLLIASGVGAVGLALVADYVGVGGGPGFGRKHWIVLGIGLTLLAAGAYLLSSERRRRLATTLKGFVRDERTLSLRWYLLVALWLGLLVGLIEFSLTHFQHATGERFMAPNVHLGWMAPVSYAALLLGLAGVAVSLDRLLATFGGLRPVVFILTFAAWFGPLRMLSPEVHLVAGTILALALAVHTTSWLTKRSSRLRRIVGRSTVPIALGVAIVGAIAPLRLALSERAARESLPAPAEGSPNVLLIILDTVRAASLSLYGYGRETTPYLERLATESVVFDRAYSTAPWTLPTHGSVFTGRYPHDLSADWRSPLDSTHLTLAEYFTARGYVTGAFVANLEYGGRHTGLERGFLHYDSDAVSAGEVLRSSALGRFFFGFTEWDTGWRPWLSRLWDFHNQLGRKRARHVSAEFLEWVSSREGRPFFAFLNYYDAHDPYRPPAPFDRKFEGAPRPDVGPIGSREWPEPLMGRWIDAYDGAIAYLDQELDALFTELHRRGIADNTLVVLTSDHGEEFAEHGLVTHGQSLYLSSLHVPLLVRYPGETPRGVRVRQPGSLRDVPATITDLLDGSSADAAFPGATLARHWRTASIDSSVSRPAPPIAQTSGKEWLPDESTAPIARGDLVSVFVDGYHVIRNGDGALEMYDLRSDYWEQDDLAATSAKRDLLERLERTMLLPLAQRYADRPGRETAGRRPSQRVTVARDGARIP